MSKTSSSHEGEQSVEFIAREAYLSADGAIAPIAQHPQTRSTIKSSFKRQKSTLIGRNNF